MAKYKIGDLIEVKYKVDKESIHFISIVEEIIASDIGIGIFHKILKSYAGSPIVQGTLFYISSTADRNTKVIKSKTMKVLYGN